MSGIERRTFHSQFRAADGKGGRRRWATAVTYNTVDDYGTLWRTGCFDAALRERMPVILYGHDWESLDHVLGRGVDFRQTPAAVGPPGVDVLIEFADPAKVPAAELAMNLLDERVLTDVSVGFVRRKWAKRDELTPAELQLGAEEAIITAGMDELSLVVRGAVVGAQMRKRPGAARTAGRSVAELQLDLARGRITPAEYRAAVAGRAPLGQTARKPVDLRAELVSGRITPAQYQAAKALNDELDQALELLNRRGIAGRAR